MLRDGTRTIGPYDYMVAAHRWERPDDYNIGADVCDWHDRGELAMIHVDPEGRGRFVAWSEIQDTANRIARLLHARGVRPGDRVGVVLPPRPESAAAILAIPKVGAAIVSMSALWSDHEIAYRLGDCQAKAILVGAERAERFEHLDTPMIPVRQAAYRDYSAAPITAATQAEDLGYIAYTSGTTSQAKGVVFPQRAILGDCEFDYTHDLRRGERSYWIGDWGWSLRKILGPWRRGAVNVVLEQPGRFDPEWMLAHLGRYQVTNAFFNATAIRLMMRDDTLGRRFPQRFRVVSSSNEKLGAEGIEWFRSQFGVTVTEFYGSTESYPLIANYPTVKVKEGALGLPCPGWRVELLDDDGQPVSGAGEGEIALAARSNPHWPVGYWNRPDETRRDFGGPWYRTGDIARRDEDGFYWYIARSDDLIKTAGYRISPLEVESVLRAHAAVDDVAVVALPHRERGHVIAAYVELVAGAVLTDALRGELQDHVGRRHSRFGSPKVIEEVEALPRSATGKLNRAQLRRSVSASQAEVAAGGSARGDSPMPGP
jgi:acetyl-CoA synthetase